MKEYIDKEVAINTIKAIPKGNWDNLRYVNELQFVPAADVRPVVHGKWILHDNGSATCSVCKCWQKLIYDDDSYQHYCGNCGAYMYGGEYE